VQLNRGSRGGAQRRSPRLKPGVKREQILDVATHYFGRYGYEETKWADVATSVGIGSTALYHYFQSKQHCLYEIMSNALDDHHRRFNRIVSANGDWTGALVSLLVDAFDLSEQEVLRQRVVVAQLARVGIPSSLPREEAARAATRARVRDLEFAWGTFLARGMQQGLVPESDPRLLTRAVLGLYNSVWHWYRPGETFTLAGVGQFIVGRQLAVLGCPPDLAVDRFRIPAETRGGLGVRAAGGPAS
jgi:TetR/AcrR family transcriptional regulator, cholesterol catabolism regulator